MNLTNVIHLLQETQTKIKIVYGNTKSTQNTAYIKTLQTESIKTLDKLIEDLTAIQKERVGLEIGAWRS
jgi:hypothetical protein|tara:strand:+ start:153 stop:359 length:207 start_codon:yes stop_codon:yes gene_type:complete